MMTTQKSTWNSQTGVFPIQTYFYPPLCDTGAPLCPWLPAKAEGGPGGRLRAGEGIRSVVLSVLPVGYCFKLTWPLLHV